MLPGGLFVSAIRSSAVLSSKRGVENNQVACSYRAFPIVWPNTRSARIVSEDDSVGNERAVYRARPNHRSQLKLETDGVWLRRSGVWIMVTLDVQETLNFLYACCAFKIEDGPT